MATGDLESRLRFLADELSRDAADLKETVVNPGFVEERLEGVTRTGQVIAFFLLGPVVVASLQIIVVFHKFMVQILGVQPFTAGQDAVMAWMVTAVTGGAILLAAWFWFQFVRTAAFGFTRA